MEFERHLERFGRPPVGSDTLMEKFMDMIKEQTMPFRTMCAYYQCAMMEVETKFRVLNEQFSLHYDRNPIESIESRLKSSESLAKKASQEGPVAFDCVD